MKDNDKAQVSLGANSPLSKDDFIRVDFSGAGDFVSFFRMREPVEIPESVADDWITAGDRTRLDLLARERYGSPELWWVIAEANGMDFPVEDVYPGRRIRIPGSEYVRSLTF